MNKFPALHSLRDFVLFIAGWRLILFITAIAATSLITLDNYPFPYVDTILEPTGLPHWIWGFANFDGVHYLRTALWGYVSQYSQAFFPLYSLLMAGFSSWNIFFEQKAVLLISGLLISFFSALGGFYFLSKVYGLVYSKKHAHFGLLLLAVFPTSFYFFGVYTESLFLLLASLAVYLILKKQYLFAGIFIALATATKVIGVFLIALYLIEVVKDLYIERKKEDRFDLFIKVFALGVAASGIILYMFYLYFYYNNPFYFINAQPVFGTGRQVETFVLLPQVFYRYLRIMNDVPINSYQFFTAFQEFIFSGLGLLLLIISFRKVRFSFWLFSLGAYILPTLTGTFTSMPRYVLMMFLLFPVVAIYIEKYKNFILPVLFVIQIIFCGMFIVGFWIA